MDRRTAIKAAVAGVQLAAVLGVGLVYVVLCSLAADWLVGVGSKSFQLVSMVLSLPGLWWLLDVIGSILSGSPTKAEIGRYVEYSGNVEAACHFDAWQKSKGVWNRDDAKFIEATCEPKAGDPLTWIVTARYRA